MDFSGDAVARILDGLFMRTFNMKHRGPLISL